MAGVTIICLTLMFLTNASFDTKSPLQITITFIAPFIVWYLGLKERKKELKNKMSFKQGLLASFKISLVYGVISPFLFMIYYFVNPSVLLFIREVYKLAEATDAVVIISDMFAQFFSAIIGGTLYGAIISFFLKTKSNR